MLKRVVLILTLLLAGLLPADTIRIRRPANGQSVSMLQAGQKFYSLQTEEQLRNLFASESVFCDELRRTVGAFPRGVELQWSFAGARDKIHYELKYADNPELANATVLNPPHSTFFLHNLEMGRTYYWQVSAVYEDGQRLESLVQSFVTDMVGPRVMYVPNVENFRDLGGKAGLEGRMSAQGLIYRSTGLNNNSSDGKVPGGARFTDEGRRIMLEDLGLKTELDLRSLGETAGMTVSPLGESIQYINISSTCYGGIYSESGRENYAKLFRVFCRRENYPINFHCIAGADRTGSLGFLLGAVLGYSVRDLIIDFTYTTFMGTRNPQLFDSLLVPMQAYGAPEESLACKAERYLLSAGITSEEIQAFRDIMLGPGTTLDLSNRLYVSVASRFANGERADGSLSLFRQSTGDETGRLCGKDYDIRTLRHQDKDIMAVSDSQGGFMFLLPPSTATDETLPLVFVADPARLTAKSYIVSSPSAQCVFTHDGGQVSWTPEALNQFCIVPPQGVFVLEVHPGADVANDWPKIGILEAPSYPVMPATVTDILPELDGKLDDPVWQRATFKPMIFVDASGKSQTSERLIAIAFDKDFGTLYLAARIPDTTPVWKGEGHDGDAYSGDSVELFLAAMGSDDYYQFVFNGPGVIYDGHRLDGKWNSAGIQLGTSMNADGWILEVAIPLAQLGFTSPIELNVCASDYMGPDSATSMGSATHFSVWRTNDYFHNRSVMRPVSCE